MLEKMNKEDFFSNFVYICGVGHENIPSLFCAGLWRKKTYLNEDEFFLASGLNRENVLYSIIPLNDGCSVYLTSKIESFEIDLTCASLTMMRGMIRAGAGIAWVCEELWVDDHVYASGPPVDGMIFAFLDQDGNSSMGRIDNGSVYGLSNGEVIDFFNKKSNILSFDKK